MKRLSIILIILLVLCLSLWAASFRVPNGFGKINLQKEQKEQIKKIHTAIYTPEVLKLFADIEKKKVDLRNEYLAKAWEVLTSEQKKDMPEKFKLKL